MHDKSAILILVRVGCWRYVIAAWQNKAKTLRRAQTICWHRGAITMFGKLKRRLRAANTYGDVCNQVIDQLCGPPMRMYPRQMVLEFLRQPENLAIGAIAHVLPHGEVYDECVRTTASMLSDQFLVQRGVYTEAEVEARWENDNFFQEALAKTGTVL
jgi:hypothetical protein